MISIVTNNLLVDEVSSPYYNFYTSLTEVKTTSHTLDLQLLSSFSLSETELLNIISYPIRKKFFYSTLFPIFSIKESHVNAKLLSQQGSGFSILMNLIIAGHYFLKTNTNITLYNIDAPWHPHIRHILYNSFIFHFYTSYSKESLYSLASYHDLLSSEFSTYCANLFKNKTSH